MTTPAMDSINMALSARVMGGEVVLEQPGLDLAVMKVEVKTVL